MPYTTILEIGFISANPDRSNSQNLKLFIILNPEKRYSNVKHFYNGE